MPENYLDAAGILRRIDNLERKSGGMVPGPR